MVIGVPKEMKDHEYRVSVTPDGVRALRQAGHEVWIERSAGVGSGYSDEDYQSAGAITAESKEQWLLHHHDERCLLEQLLFRFCCDGAGILVVLI